LSHAPPPGHEPRRWPISHSGGSSSRSHLLSARLAKRKSQVAPGRARGGRGRLHRWLLDQVPRRLCHGTCLRPHPPCRTRPDDKSEATPSRGQVVPDAVVPVYVTPESDAAATVQGVRFVARAAQRRRRSFCGGGDAAERWDRWERCGCGAGQGRVGEKEVGPARFCLWPAVGGSVDGVNRSFFIR
jgi:hypothetical protein